MEWRRRKMMLLLLRHRYHHHHSLSQFIIHNTILIKMGMKRKFLNAKCVLFILFLSFDENKWWSDFLSRCEITQKLVQVLIFRSQNRWSTFNRTRVLSSIMHWNVQDGNYEKRVYKESLRKVSVQKIRREEEKNQSFYIPTGCENVNIFTTFSTPVSLENYVIPS